MSQKKKILVVDDDVDMLHQVAMMLSDGGYEVIIAEGERGAEEELVKFHPDLVILDIMMEHEDSGFVISHQVKKLYPETPVIFLSSVNASTGISFPTDTPEERSWIKADAFLNKPVRAESLKNEVERLLA
ncbi:MAG TPA: response regulator [bacterium]|nr:response regulator [Myxococcales bacterium]OQA62154.1 MAG: Transcriptional regulatory protein YycF [bacterium ADurb.Bin270]HPW45710.1 response regulator [bacterium]HQC50857.1 response regulator [bacterium]HQG12757.1 response regulator [bacterium]